MANLNKHRKTLLILSKAKPRAARKIIANAEPSLIKALSEISLNILNGLIPLTPARKKRIGKYKNQLRDMTSNASLDTKRHLLTQSGGMIGALLSMVAPLIFKGVGKLISHIKNKRAAKKRRAHST